MNCGANGLGNTTPDPTSINFCAGVGSKNIDLNTGSIFFNRIAQLLKTKTYYRLPIDMALVFPLVSVTSANELNGNLLQLPDGGTLAKPLAHCVLDRKDLAGHQIALNDLRCYGPGDGLPQGKSNAPFNEFQFVAGPFIDDATVTIPAWNDPTGTLQTVLANFVPLVISFSRPTDGSNANTNFLKAFEQSWVKMVTAGYTELTGTSGKLGSLTNFNGC